MAKINPEQERQRLADFYSRQRDGELQKVASQAYELTDLAREVLREELKKRDLSVDLVEERLVVAKAAATAPPDNLPPPNPPDAAPDGEVDPRKMVTIRKFRDLPEALIGQRKPRFSRDPLCSRG